MFEIKLIKAGFEKILPVLGCHLVTEAMQIFEVKRGFKENPLSKCHNTHWQ